MTNEEAIEAGLYYLVKISNEIQRVSLRYFIKNPKTIVVDIRYLTLHNTPTINASSFGHYEFSTNGDRTLSWRASDPTEYPEFILALTLEGYI